MTTCSIELQKWQVLGPSDALINKLRDFPTDHTEEVKSYLNSLLSTFMESFKSTTTEEKTLVRAEQCCFKAKEWYYKILESFLLDMDQRPKFTNVASLLETKSSQCGLVLCCLEMAFYTNKLAYNFTLLLQRFDLAAYNLLQAVDVVLCQVDLTADIKKHLYNVVALIIEKLAWTQNSPLWEEISANEGRLPTCKQVMTPEELEGLAAMTHLDHDTNLNITDSTTDEEKSTLNRPHRGRFIRRFTRWVYWSVHKSLSLLCSKLKLQDEQQKIWTCFENSLVHHFDLLRDQHVDWLLLCAIHSMTKVAEREIPLRLIIDTYNCYKKNIDAMEMLKGNSAISLEHEQKKDWILTPSTPSLQDQECDQISCFYTRVYAPVMGQYLEKFRPTPGVETPPLSPYPTPTSTRKRRVCDHLNVFVSPWNKQTASPAPEGMCYEFHSSPSQCLRDINSAIKSRGNPLKRRRLQLDEGSDGGPSANSLLEKILAVEHDRAQLNVEPASDQ